MSDAIVACLRTYGAIVVDRAAVPRCTPSAT